MAFEFYEFLNGEECSGFLAQNFAGFAERRILERGFVNLAFSGGRSPVDFFEKLSRVDLTWEKTYISLVDERMVLDHHQDSNARLIRDHLLQNQASTAHLIPLVQDLCDDAGVLDTRKVLEFASRSYRQPDFAVLGMGVDGHTASLFPCAVELENALKTDENIVLVTPKNAAHTRLSMSLRALEGCQRLFLLIAGEEKRKIFDQAAFEKKMELPISFILHSRKVQCDVYYSR